MHRSTGSLRRPPGIKTDPIVLLLCSLPYILFSVHMLSNCRVNIEYMQSHLSHSSDIVDAYSLF